MTAKSENSDSNLKTVKTEKDASNSDCGLTAALNMNGLQQAAWPFLAGSPQANANALLQSYAKLAFPDFDQSNALAPPSSNEPQSPSRVPLLPPFAVPPAMFVGASPSLVPQFGPMPPTSIMQPSVSDAGPLLLPPGTQLDPSTLAAITAAAAAYQQMNAGGAMCQFDFPGGARRKNATRETTSTLKAWLHEHRKNPYPTKAEKIMLAILTRMSLTQVSTWFANARRRLKKESKMNSWASSQQQTRGADGGHAAGGKAQQGGAERGDDSDNSVCDDNDNMDFDADSIDIDGECVSDGDRPGTCGSGKGQDESDPSGHPDCRQCSSRPNECGIEHADQHRAPPSSAMTIGLADGAKSGALQHAIRTASNNNNAQAAADKSHKITAATTLSVDTCFSKIQPHDGNQIDAALLRQTMFNGKLLLPTGGESRECLADGAAQQSQSIEKNKFWSLVDTATSPQQSANLNKPAPQTSRSEVATRSALPDGNPDLQSPQVQEFLRNFLAFSAKMQAAVTGGEPHAASSGLPSIIPPFAAPDLGLPAELVAHGGMPNMQNDPFANAAVLYLNMIKQKGLV